MIVPVLLALGAAAFYRMFLSKWTFLFYFKYKCSRQWHKIKKVKWIIRIYFLDIEYLILLVEHWTSCYFNSRQEVWERGFICRGFEFQNSLFQTLFQKREFLDINSKTLKRATFNLNNSEWIVTAVCLQIFQLFLVYNYCLASMCITVNGKIIHYFQGQNFQTFRLIFGLFPKWMI